MEEKPLACISTLFWLSKRHKFVIQHGFQLKKSLEIVIEHGFHYNDIVQASHKKGELNHEVEKINCSCENVNY